MTRALDNRLQKMRPSADMKRLVMVMSSLLVAACGDDGSNASHLDGGMGDGGGSGSNVTCDTTMTLAAGDVYTDYSVAASDVLSDTATAYEWSVTSDSPCDAIIKENDGEPYSLSGQTTENLTFRPTLPGDYTVALKATTASGTVNACGKVHVDGGGLRIELCSDGTQQTDIDLHVHRPGSTAAWFDEADDCYSSNCIASNRVDWGLTESPLAACEKSPNGGRFTPLGGCPNPRMDSDSLDFREVENTTIDNPPAGMPIRVMAAYYSGSGTAIHPVVAIYCNGKRKAVYGTPDQVMGFNDPGGLRAGSMWRVADVTMNGSDCTVTPLHPPSMSTGYYVTDDDTTY